MSALVADERKKSSTSGLGSISELIGQLSGIAGQFQEKETKVKTSGSTRTTGLDVSKEGVDALIQQILQGSGGLADVSSGQRAAGLYNSTTNQQLTNDLTARTAGEVAKLQAKTVTADSGQTVTTVQPPQSDLISTLLTTGAGYVGKKLLDKTGVLDTIGGAVDSGIGSAVDAIGGLFSSGASAAGSVSAAADFASGISDFGVGLGSQVGTFGDALGGLGDSFGGFGDALGGADSFAGGMPIASIGLDLLNGKPEDALATGAGFLIGNAILPGVGGVIGSLLTDVLPIGDIFGDIGSSIGDLFSSVVCTELHAQGLMSKYLYTVDVAYAHKYMSKDTLDGYRYWGIPLVKLMRKSPTVTKIVAWFAVSRAHYVVSQFDDGFYNAKLARRGKIINAIGVPLCKLIAAVTTPKDWTTLYTKAGV